MLATLRVMSRGVAGTQWERPEIKGIPAQQERDMAARKLPIAKELTY